MTQPNEHTRSGVLILAGGASSRLGRPKQLLDFQGESLIGRLVNTINGLKDFSILVVTGAYHPEITVELAPRNIPIYLNRDWHEGIGSSIRNGIGALLATKPHLARVIITVSDQPFITVGHLTSIVEKSNDLPQAIIASAYADTIGTPVLFPSKFFPFLLALRGNEGAKIVLNKFASDVVSVTLPNGEIDIDTVDDYAGLRGE